MLPTCPRVGGDSGVVVVLVIIIVVGAALVLVWRIESPNKFLVLVLNPSAALKQTSSDSVSCGHCYCCWLFSSLRAAAILRHHHLGSSSSIIHSLLPNRVALLRESFVLKSPRRGLEYGHPVDPRARDTSPAHTIQRARIPERQLERDSEPLVIRPRGGKIAWK